MARFAQKKQSAAVAHNLAGGRAYKIDPKLELVSILLTSFVQDKHYRTADGEIARIREILEALPDLSFAAKAAVFARREFGMRSISHVVAGLLPSIAKARNLDSTSYGGAAFYNAVVRRVDDVTETLAAYSSLNQQGVKTKSATPIPGAMKRGLASAFGRFDGYQLAKYRGTGKDWKLIDAVNLVHPKPSPKNADALKALVAGTLRNSETWESKLSAAGNAGKSKESKKQEAWKDLIKEGKLGQFALLRNLRNLLEQADEETLNLALEQLVDQRRITSSLILPFRYYTAIKEIEAAYTAPGDVRNKVLVALNTALELSMVAVPTLGGRTLVAIDHSGSMNSLLSDKSGLQYIEVAALFGVVLAKSNDADLMIFGDDAKYVSYNPADSTTTMARWIANDLNNHAYGRLHDTPYYVGHGTSIPSVFARANKAYDRVIILSDMQTWGTAVAGGDVRTAHKTWCKKMQCDPFIYTFDLSGYGTLSFPENKVLAIAGWSEKTLGIMEMLEQDRNALVNKIESVTFTV